MFEVSRKSFDVFHEKMYETYLLEITFILFKKYPLVKCLQNYSDAYNKVKNRIKYFKTFGIEQRKNLEFWIELSFIFGEDFLDRRQFSKIKALMESINNQNYGETDISFQVYEIIKSVCLYFDDLERINKLLLRSEIEENSLHNFLSIISEFKNYYDFFDEEGYWISFYNRYSTNYNLKKIVYKALSNHASLDELEK